MKLRQLNAALVVVLFLGAAVQSARADISFVDMFRNGEFLQTGNGNTLTPIGYFFSTRLTSTDANEFSTVQMTYPGPGSPVFLSQVGPTLWQYQTGFLPDQAAMDAAFPFGTYQYDATGGMGTLTTSFDYTQDFYPQTTPYLDGTTYAALQGMNASAPFNFLFSPYDPGMGAAEAFLFLTIFDYNLNAFVYSAGFLPPTTTGLTLPANTLQPGDNFAYELIFSNRFFTDSPGADFAAQIGYDLRTTGTFSTAAPAAVPEPASVVLFGFGCFGLAGYALRRRRTV